MESSDCIYSIYEKSILLEHDYSGRIRDNVRGASEDGELGKKLRKSFDAVDKWADSVVLRVHTGDDRRKIVDREITILKVKYPFLPEQQIRGKVYKKFGIPAVMGGVLSRLLSGWSPKNRPKSRRRDSNKTEDVRKIVKPEKLYESENMENAASKCNYTTFNEKSNDDKSNFLDIISNSGSIDDAVTEKMSIHTNQEEHFTPDIPLVDSQPIVSQLIIDELSINRESEKLTDRISNSLDESLDLNTPDSRQVRGESDTIPIYSQLTRSLSPGIQALDSRTFEIPLFDQSKIGTENLDEMPTQIYVPEENVKSTLPNSSSKINSQQDSQKYFSPRDLNGNLIMKNSLKLRRKRIINDELATKTMASTRLEITKEFGLKGKFKVNDKPYDIIQLSQSFMDSADITTGTKTPLSELTPNSVILDHSYSGKTNKSYYVTHELEDSETENETRQDHKFVKKELILAESKKRVEKREKNLKKRKNKRFTMNRKINFFENLNENDEIHNNEISSTPRKKRRLCSRSSTNCQTKIGSESNRIRKMVPELIDISNDDETIAESANYFKSHRSRSSMNYQTKNNFESNQSCENVPELIDISDDHETIAESSNDSDHKFKVIPVTFTPWRADLPLFVVIDSLSNHCCEYDQGISTVNEICNYANNFIRETGTSLKDSFNVKTEEIKENIEEILNHLATDCRD